MQPMYEAHAPEPVQSSEPVEMHIVKKRGKFHGHVIMSDGAEHHAPPHATMHEAHGAMAAHIAQPGNQVENASEPLEREERELA